MKKYALILETLRDYKIHLITLCLLYIALTGLTLWMPRVQGRPGPDPGERRPGRP